MGQGMTTDTPGYTHADAYLAIVVYSTSAVDSTGVVSFLELHVIAPPFRINMLLLVGVKSWLLAKLASAYP